MTLIRYALCASLLMGGAHWAKGEEPESDSLYDQLNQVTDQMAGVQERLAIAESDIAKLKKVKITGYVQARYEYHDDAIGSPALGTTSSDKKNQGQLLNRFFIRRTRLKAAFQASPNAAGAVSFDGSASGVSLKDAYVSVTEPWSQLTFTLGQFNWLFGYEISFSSSKREFPERARWARTLFPGERDRGVKVETSFLVEDRYTLGLQAGLYNGNGVDDKSFNSNDPNKSKDVIARATCGLGFLDFGVSGYWGKQFNPSDQSIPAQQPSTTDKIRYGVDAQYFYELPRLGGGVLKGELVAGKEPKNAKGFLSGDTTRNVLGLDIVWAQNLRERFQWISRLDFYDPDRDTEQDQTTTYGLGLIYFWDGNSKLKLIYEIPKTAGKNEVKDNTITLEWVYTI
ncbi:MAG: porin [Candidatus Zixiibacteriota bacterium]